jgi:hypothetical protein
VTAELFDVVRFFADGSHEPVKRNVGAAEAVLTAKAETMRPAVVLGVVVRIIITDSGDLTVFDWRAGQGVIFPPREELRP